LLALALTLALTAGDDSNWSPPRGLSLLEAERTAIENERRLADDQRGSTRPGWFFLGSGLVTMLSGFLALELVGNLQDPSVASSQVQIAPSTWAFVAIAAGGLGAIVGALITIWLKFRDTDVNRRIELLDARLERIDAAIAAESPAQVAPDGNSFVPRAF
jgi:hypothetical protein